MLDYDEFAPLEKLLESDKRYARGAYTFVNDVIELAATMGMGEKKVTEHIEGVDDEPEQDERCCKCDKEHCDGDCERHDDECDEPCENNAFIEELERLIAEAAEETNAKDDDDDESSDCSMFEDWEDERDYAPEETTNEDELVEAVDELNKQLENELKAFRPSEEEAETEEDDLDLHITGQELCRVAVQYAVALYGMMARVTLERLGLKTTEDIGNVVYNMISVGLMAKSPDDSIDDFNDVFDLGEELDNAFKFSYTKRRR